MEKEITVSEENIIDIHCLKLLKKWSLMEKRKKFKFLSKGKYVNILIEINPIKEKKVSKYLSYERIYFNDIPSSIRDEYFNGSLVFRKEFYQKFYAGKIIIWG